VLGTGEGSGADETGFSPDSDGVNETRPINVYVNYIIKVKSDNEKSGSGFIPGC